MSDTSESVESINRAISRGLRERQIGDRREVFLTPEEIARGEESKKSIQSNRVFFRGRFVGR
jgi:hypothetical protein